MRIGYVALAAGLATLVAGCGGSGVSMQSGAAAAGAASGSDRSAVHAVPTVTEVSQLGRIRAVLKYPQPRDGRDVYQARLLIFRSGRLLLDERLLPPWPNYGATPSDVWWFRRYRRRSLVVRDLDRDGEPEVLVNLHGGGAHEIPYTYIYSYERGTPFSRPMYDGIQHVWDDPGVRLTDLNRDRTPEFIGGDSRFEYRFVGHYVPIQIWEYRRKRLLDVTRRFQAAIRRDLARYRACLPNHARRGRDERSCLAAWAADEALLGQVRLIWPVLEAARVKGNLGPGYAPFPPYGRAYIAAVRSFLHRTGYLA